MKLTNLFVQAAIESTNHSTAKAWQTIIRELPGRSAIAGLPWQLPKLESYSKEKIARIETALNAYLPVADALAHDKPEEALSQRTNLAESLSQLVFDSDNLAGQVTAATDEKSLQSALRSVTSALSELIAEGAHDQLGQLYLVHCPMAFSNEGGDWFSRKPVVENPYFGSRMFSCGDVTEALSIPLSLSSEELKHLAHPEKESSSQPDHTGH